MKVLSERLRVLRNRIEKSQKIVSKELGIPQTTYAAYEINKSEPSASMLVDLALYYEVSTDYLLGKTDTKYTQVELDFFNELKEKNIDQLIQEYNLTLGDEAMGEKDERILIKLIKSFMEDKD